MSASPQPPPCSLLPAPPRSLSSWLILPALLATFIVGLFPLTADYVLFHPDERHYADAGIVMLETGDYLTPRTAEGDLRLKKPILPYWCTAAGYHVAGISPLGARLGFLLAGAAIVGLAWWGARTAFDSRRAAGFAAVTAMTQPALIISAPRSVPDVLLALGVQLSVCGFLRIERDGRATGPGLAAAFGGGALAVLSKGLPGAAFLGFALLFTAWRSPALLWRDRRRWTAALGLCVIICGSWFGLMAGLHTAELVQQFGIDQAGPNRFAQRPWQPLVQFPLCIGLLAAMSAPWLIAVGPELRTSAARSRLWRHPGVPLIVSWGLLYCSLAALINHVTPRYLLPAAAPLSIVVGGLLHHVDASRLRQRLWRVLPIGGALLAACLLTVGLQLVARPAWLLTGVLAALLMTIALSLRIRRCPAATQAFSVAAALHVLLFGGAVGLSLVRDGGIGALVERQLRLADGEAQCRRIVFEGEAAHAAQIRVALGHRLPVEPTSSFQHAGERDLLVLDAGRAVDRDLAGYETTTLTCGYRDMDAVACLRSLLAGQLSEFLKRSERRFVIAAPRDQPATGETRTAAKPADHLDR